MSALLSANIMGKPFPKSSAKIVVVDDHPLMRLGLRCVFSEHQQFTLAGEASTGEEAVVFVQQTPPDLVIMDSQLRDMSVAELVAGVSSLAPAAKFIVISSDLSRAAVDSALQSGIDGYLSTWSSAVELVHAVTVVLNGKVYLNSEVSTGIIEDYRQSLTSPATDKTPVSIQDRKLLELICEGRRNKEIATQLNISIKSVEAYRSRLMKKLGFTSSAELIRYAVRERIIKP